MKTGTLYIVSTPIGNLEDITMRAIRVLREVFLVAAEDTRKTQILFSAYGIHTPLTSYYSYNASEKTPRLIRVLKEGKDVALVSDSGTPGISDPGSRLITECMRNGIVITAAPGPTALIMALVVSGKATHKFVYEGFLSNKSAARRKQLEKLKDEKRTVIIYESPHRIVKFLKDFIEIAGDREIAVMRELTKKFEEVRREPASAQLEHFSGVKPKGEFVIVF